MRRLLLAPLLLSLALAPVAALAVAPINASFFSKVAIDGTDPVAYFTDGRPVAGNSSFATTWNGATWYFASAAHRDLFTKDPNRYAPQFGGYCAWAVSQGSTADIDPAAWKIVGGKLYLNYSLEIQKKWEADIPGNIARGNANWPGLLAN